LIWDKVSSLKSVDFFERNQIILPLGRRHVVTL